MTYAAVTKPAARRDRAARLRTRLLVIRHGRAWCNDEDVVAGVDECRGLTELGHLQARAVAQRLAAEHDDIAAVFSSPIKRAAQTATHIAWALGIGVESNLPAPDYGGAVNQPWRIVLGRHNPPLALTPDVPLALGAESWTTWVRRVGLHIDQLTEQHRGQTLVLVTHREAVIAMAQHFSQAPPTLAHVTLDVANTAITEWEQRPLVSPWSRWALVRHNDARHIEAVNDPRAEPWTAFPQFDPPTAG
ncbi:histidine phosphatase family protein [Nocardia suismassiliense]|uniref:histidine phosphatase family protein n=1 Tax=Nocardia suismassiliense TaxID=2077092 RepID=UPI000D1FD8B3|nr:histidine phosphatase family protein [Nocardia suismassiliense]